MLRAVGSNWVLSAYTIVSTLVMGPVVVGVLGAGGDGRWAIVNAATGLLGLLALGVPMATVRYFSEDLARGDMASLNRSIGSSAGFYLMLGALTLAVGALAYLPFDSAYIAPEVARGALPAGEALDMRWAYGLMVAHVALSFIGLLPYGVMAAHGDFVLRNRVMMIALSLKLVGTVAVLPFVGEVRFLAVLQLAALAVEFVLARALVLRKYPGVRLSLADFDWAVVRRIFSFSAYVLLLQLGIKLSFHVDSLVIGAHLDDALASHYSRANTFIIYLVEFLVGIGAVVMPAATRMRVTGDEAKLHDIFLKWSKVAVILTVLATLFLGILGPEFVAAWLHDDAYRVSGNRVLPWLMLSCLFFLPVRGVGLPVLMGLGKPGAPTIAFLVAGSLNLGLSLALVGPLGLMGIALGTAIPNVLFAVFTAAFVCRVLELRPGHYLRYVALRPLLAALPVLPLLWWLKEGYEVRTRLEVIAAGLATVALYAVSSLAIGFRGDPLIRLPGPLARFGGRSPED